MESLAKIFGSAERLKVMRFFLFNPKTIIGALDLAHMIRVNPKTVQKEILVFGNAGFIKKKVLFRTETLRKSGKTIQRKEKIRGWILDDSFPYLFPLKQLLVGSKAFQHDIIVEKFKNVGRIKLLLVSGVFIQNEQSKVDLLVVGEGVRKSLIKRIVRVLEGEIGKGLRYAVMDSEEFLYRQGINDKFLRDILDYPHEKLINKLDLR